MTTVEYSKGLEGVIVAESSICKIDGQAGELYYRGYSIDGLVEKVSFEEVIYLLLHGDLPTGAEFEAFQLEIRSQRDIEPKILDMIRNFPRDSHPMELLQSGIAYLGAYHPTHDSDNCMGTLHQAIQLATLVAAYHRISQGLDYVPPRSDLSFGGNFLYMLRGTAPDAFEADIMDASLILHAEHHFNASTFTARVVASTNSSCYSCISAAIGALYGSLHGGANERVMNMVREIGSPDKAEDWVSARLAKKQKIMGMGHRVYKVKDPRAVIMEGFLETLSREKDNDCSYRILQTVERVAGDHIKQKAIYPNVDFFSGSVYDLLGIPSKLFTPVFAASRVSGWLAHILEQRENNRIYRPSAIYTGPDAKTTTTLAER